ncbi:Ff.00g004070.m01.CDS01 [Fusarium sp. VM40]|nr:Ff.00g004070.m01.CDS01 [Fusarium sp. VM40]
MTSKTVHLTTSALNSWIEEVEAGELVHQLFLVGIHDEDGERRLREPPATREELVYLLAQAFNGLVKGGVNPLSYLGLRIDSLGPLTSGHQIQIKTELEARSTSKSAWQCSIDTFFVAMQALAASKLQVEKLNLFNDDDMKLFALPSDQLNIIDWDNPDICHALAALKSLRVNISTPAYAFHQIDGEGGSPDWLGRVTELTASQIRTEIEHESNFDGLAKLIAKCPQLEDFEYLWLGIPLPGLKELQGLKFPGWKILYLLTELPNLPKLRRCAFRYLITRDTDVLEFLKRTQPNEVFIGPMWLDEGKYQPIVDYCNSKEANMTKLFVKGPLYQLAQSDLGQVHFQRQEYDEDAECSPHLRREGDAVQRPIHFHIDPQGFVEPGSTYCDLILDEGMAINF